MPGPNCAGIIHLDPAKRFADLCNTAMVDLGAVSVKPMATESAFAPTQKAPGAYEIQGKEIVALVQEYETAPANVAPWETHNYHLDVQYLVSGEEKIGYGRRENVVPTQAYNQKDDYDLIKAVPGDYYSIKDDGFMILFPEDAHQPRVAAGDKGMKVKKICIKVLV